MQGYVSDLYESLGLYIPLIVVNCIILGRAESYASKNPAIPSIFDGVGMGLGFTIGLTLIGMFREILGAGQLFGAQVLPLADAAAGKAGYTPITIFVLSVLVAVMNILRKRAEAKGKPLAPAQGCLAGDCSSCGNALCSGHLHSSEKKSEG